ncbi:glycosyltransferase family 4 protein [Natrarchaeobius sp. A-rgal3]|uniref:glycosyltransferase family 4 protein n=1 Tax=Natrarchaeobius versutus TaxID=1679078 RepID=UPI0035102319
MTCIYSSFFGPIVEYRRNLFLNSSSSSVTMRIAFIHPRYPTSEGTGAAHSATQIVNGLADVGHEVCVYCTRPPPERTERDGISLRHLDGYSNHPHTPTRQNREVESRVDELTEFDLVHSYLMRLIPSIGEVGKQSDVGTVVTLNAYGGICAKNDLRYQDDKQCQSKSIFKCFNCIASTGFHSNEHGYLYETASQLLSLRLINSGESRLEFIDGFRAPSTHVRNNYVQFGYDSEKIATIPHPIDEDFSLTHRSTFSEPYKLLYVGSLSRHKGVQTLVPIMERLNKTEWEFELTVVGTGELERRMHEQVENYDVEDAVQFAGFISNAELPEVYASHDCLIHPSVWEEPLARVYLEALATETPIVTTDYGCIEEIVGEAGRLADGTAESFCDTIVNIVESNELPEMSVAAGEQAEQFELSRVISQLNVLYDTVTE